MTLYEAIFRRKSIRKYKDDVIDETILKKVENFGEDAVWVRPDIRIKWKVFRPEDKKPRGLFQVKAPYYVALYSEICEDYRKNAGCLMEQLSLYLHAKGIGSCYQGGASLPNDEKEELEMVMLMAFGYPAEPLERESEDFRRADLKTIVKTQDPLRKIHRRLLEPARLAPSAVNLQPWRFVVNDDKIHLFVRKPGRLIYQKQLDMNLFDAGIALSHMLVTAEELWLDVVYQKLDRIMEKEFQNYLYAGSLIILNESEKI